MIRLSHHWYGYLFIRLIGYCPERFLNLCSAGGIEIWGITYRNGAYEFYMTLKGFRSCKPFAKKSKVRLKILKKAGLPFFLYRNRKRKLLFAGFAIFFLLLYLLSLFIWDISFEGNYRYTDDVLTDYFVSRDIRYGMPKRTISCEVIESGLRNEFPEITWVSARVSGTRLLVKIKENEVLSAIPEKDDAPCDIVAAAPGTITSIIVRQGVAQVSVGDEVKKGQLLVSGGVPITDDGDALVRTKYVHADADICAETEHIYQKKFPSLHQVKAKTGRKKTGYFVKALDYDMVFLLPGKKESLWTFVMEEQQLKLFESFYLPFYIGEIKGEEYVTYERFYTEIERNRIAEAVQNRFLENLMQKGVQIIENDVKILENESVCRIEGNAVTREQIGVSQIIMETEGAERSDERN